MSQSPANDPAEQEWVFQEFGEGVHFGDQRLNRRFEKIAQSLANRPSRPINHATEDWAATKAAYRFFDNPKVSSEKILSSRFRNTIDRVEAQERVVVAQDTSVLNFARHHKTKGLGMTSKPHGAEGAESKGLFFHTVLAMKILSLAPTSN